MVYSVGHSTLRQDEFLDLLHSVAVTQIWDVRSYPTSHWAWFHRASMEEWLPDAGIDYRWVPTLGGRRGKRCDAPEGESVPPPASQSTWRAKGFANYQWHMTTDEFLKAADELRDLGTHVDVAIMCAESLWWRCHRSMIADYLVVADADVVHLQPKTTRHSHAIGDRLERYDPEVLAVWQRHLGDRYRRPPVQAPPIEP